MAAILCVVGCGPPDSATEPIAKQLTAVEVVRLDAQDGQSDVSGIGTVAYDREVTLSFPVAGILTLVVGEEGSPVAAGQVLARIQADTAAADLRAANAEVARAGQARRRIETLAAKGFATRAQLEAVQATDAAARARVEQFRFIARNTALRAPVSGRILSRQAEAGQVVQPGTPILRLGEGSAGLVARLAFPENSGIRVGAPIALSLGNAGPTGRISDLRTAIVRRVLPIRNAATGTIEVEIGLPAGLAADVGTIVRGTARVTGRTPVIRIPLSALVDGRTDQASVYLVDAQNRIQRRDVSFDGFRGDQIAVTHGLSAGDRVVQRGVPYVRPGEQVKVLREVAGQWLN